MTTMDLNTYKLELIRDISAANSFEDVKRAFRNISLRALRSQETENDSISEEECSSKEEILEEIKQSVKEMKAMKAGKMKAITWEEMLNEL